jgi:hypothetical protein
MIWRSSPPKKIADLDSRSRNDLSSQRRDGLETLDCVNVLRAGSVDPGEYENGSWRYPVRTARLTVVVAFRSETVLVVVTAWRQRT